MTDRIEKTIDLKAPIERVWRALTDHRAFGAWFGVNIEGPFAEGQPSRGQFTIAGYEYLKWNAEIVRMEAQRFFSWRWHPYAVEQGVDYSHETPTLVEFRLEPNGAGTRLTVTESGFEKLPAHRRDEAFRMNEGGWEQQMENIRSYVER